MGRSSVLGSDEVPLEAPSRDEEALGPSNSSDSGSDLIGADDLPTADPGEPVDVTLGRDVARTPIEREDGSGDEPGADISVDQIFSPEEQEIDGLDNPEPVDKSLRPKKP